MQFVWQHQLLQGELHTTDGTPLTIIKPGLLNRDAGPDFSNAKIRIGNVLWVGNVELHVRASDWKAHGHSGDENYSNIILHVVYTHDYDIVMGDGKRVATVEISSAIPAAMVSQFDEMAGREDGEVACSRQLLELPPLLLRSVSDRLLVERMERKVRDIDRLLQDSIGEWELVCYWMVARYFGGKTNAYAFEMLAKFSPLKTIAKIKDNPFRVEALLMGQSGLLDASFKDDYPARLKKEYQYLQHAYRLTPMKGYLWKFFRLRPTSFPTLRISQLAALITGTSHLFARMVEIGDVAELKKLFRVSASEYWETHYRFDIATETHSVIIGDSFIDILIINAWAPLLFEYGVRHAREDLCDRAFSLLHQMKAEDNYVVRMWKRMGLIVEDAAYSQSLVQLYNEHCMLDDCLSCPIGYHVLKSKCE